MFKKGTAFVLSIILTITLLSACTKQNDISSGAGEKDFPVTIGDVTISSQPTGVAVLSPNAADVVLALGYEINLKAKSAQCTQSDLTALPNVTADDAEKIKEAGADLVFTDAKLTEDQQNAMQKNGITVLTLSPANSRADLARLYSEVGAAIKGAVTGYEKGQSIASGVWETIDDITREIPQSKTAITGVYLYDADGHAATGDTIAGNLVTAAGMQNVAESSENNEYSIDDLLLSNPKYIFCATGVKEALLASEKLKQLDAVKSNRVYEMDPSMMKLQGEQIINAVSFMAGTVYPQLNQSTASSTAPSSSASSSTGTSSKAASSSPSSSKAASSAAPSSSSSGMNLNQTLKMGMQSNDVLTMQNRLLDLGYMFVKPSGLFAEGTQQAVKDFQFLNGLPATGVADPVTLQKMFSDSAVKRTD
jgi:iron complex transport system substrate-binding protein